jgi:branched-chain amino acid transport system permease protein
MNQPPFSVAVAQPATLHGAAGLLHALPWALALAVYFLLPGYAPLATQMFVMILFALSLDLLVGYAGIVTLGHAALFGTGAYTAGILATHGVTDPILTALVATAAAALVGLVTGACMLRTKGLALLMLSMAAAFLLYELANKATGLTGGDDGLQGISFGPVLGLFDFDFRGRTAFLYSLAVLFLCFQFVRTLVNAPFGWSLRGIRENDRRMVAVGCPIFARRLTAYVIASALAGLAGALQAQTTQFVALHVLSFELSGDVLVMLILGGSGHLYGAFLGVPLFMFAQDILAKQDPANWHLGQGIILITMVLFAPGGLTALAQRAAARWRRRSGR